MEAQACETTPLFTAYRMGRFNLSHRIVLPPLSRNRSYNNIPQPHAIKYYSERTTEGGFLISESAGANQLPKGCCNMPGIWNKEQIEAWKPIVSAVHEKGGKFFCQIWHSGALSNYYGKDKFLNLQRGVFVQADPSYQAPGSSIHEGDASSVEKFILFDRESIYEPANSISREDDSSSFNKYLLLDGDPSCQAPSSSTHEGDTSSVEKFKILDRQSKYQPANSVTREEDSSTFDKYLLLDGESTYQPANSVTREEDSSSFDKYLLLDGEPSYEAPKPSTHEEDSTFVEKFILFDRESTYQPTNSVTHQEDSSSVNKYILFDRESKYQTSDSWTNIHGDNSHYDLKAEDMPLIVNDFKIAARNAIEAGFDGVEILGANGYLIDQFLKDTINNRTDQYGGNVENRCRLALEIVEVVANEIGPDRVGIKLSPFDNPNGINDSNPEVLALYMANALNKFGICYLQVSEPRMVKIGDEQVTRRCLGPMRKAFKGTFIASGGFDKFGGEKAIEEGYADLVTFGRLFLANPDLPNRFKLNAPLNKHNRSTFYIQDPVIGYTDYPRLEVNVA